MVRLSEAERAELERRRGRLQLELRLLTATLRSDQALRLQQELRPADARPRLHHSPASMGAWHSTNCQDPAPEPNRECSILIFCGRPVVTPLDQLRLRLPEHDFVRLMEAAARPSRYRTATPSLRTLRRSLAARGDRPRFAASDHQRSAAAL